MPYIDLSPDLPGMRALLSYSPETAKPLNALADLLLHSPNSLTPGERELIAAFVSAKNDCFFCQTIHGAIAACHFDNEKLVGAVKSNPETAAISPKLKALLAIAGKVAESGKHVLPVDIERAKANGVTDREIHDTVLIAAFFCMCNRYVDGLATWAPTDLDQYRQRAARVAAHGYSATSRELYAPAELAGK